MFKAIPQLLAILIVLCSTDFTTAFANDVRPVFEETKLFDINEPQVELWYGTKLDALRLPGIVWMSSEPPPDENNVGKPNKLNVTKVNITNSNFRPDKESEDFFNGMDETSSLAFAEPFDFNVWVLVKWTVVVLVIAAIATFFLRGKQVRLPTLQSSRELRVLETLAVDQRARLHLVAVGGERFLIATDSTGVKSTTLVPNWNLTEEIDDQFSSSNEAVSSAAAISISEAG